MVDRCAAGLAPRVAGRSAMRCLRLRFWFRLCTLLLVPAGGWAQGVASLPLATDHWAYAALDRLDAAGLLNARAAGGGRPHSVRAVADAFRHVAERGGPAAAGGGPGAAGGARHGGAAGAARLADFARDALDRLSEEYPELGAGNGARRDPVRSGLAVGLVGAGRSEGGRSWSGAVLDARVRVGAGERFAFLHEPVVGVGSEGGGKAEVDLSHRRFLASARFGRLRLAAGRERLEFATGASGGVVLSDAVPIDGVTLGLEEAMWLPWLGPVQGMAFVARIGGDALGDDAVLAGMRLSFAPHRRVRLSLNRTLVAATEVRGERIRPADVMMMLVGKHTLFEDQRASVGIQVAAEVAQWPVQTYLEWGFEDTAGLDEDPAVVVGLYLPMVPGAPGVALRYEYTGFGEAARLLHGCCSEPRSWYRHNGVRSRYASGDGVPFGHPLGGYGHEHRLEAGTWLAGSRLRGRLAAFVREREPGNILDGVYPGRSAGGELDAHFRLSPNLELSALVRAEEGAAGWSRGEGRVGLHVVVGRR